MTWLELYDSRVIFFFRNKNIISRDDGSGEGERDGGNIFLSYSLIDGQVSPSRVAVLSLSSPLCFPFNDLARSYDESVPL